MESGTRGTGLTTKGTCTEVDAGKLARVLDRTMELWFSSEIVGSVEVFFCAGQVWVVLKLEEMAY